MIRESRLFIANEWTDGAASTPLYDKFSGEHVANVHEASQEQVRRALEWIADGHQRAALSPYQRYTVLSRAAAALRADRARFVDLVVTDTGFTVADAEREVDRAVETLTLCAEECKRLNGEVVPFDGAPGVVGRYAITLRRPLGVVCAITPFNSPLNTLIHKVGPAIAAGNAVVIKPASYTPLTAAAVVDLLLDAGLPPELVALLNGSGGTVGRWLLESPIPQFYAFTGSTEVGEQIQRTVGLRRTQLELGSLASTIVCADANLSRAVPLCVNAAFRKAGQVCTSIQRLYVEDSVFDDVTSAFVAELAQRVVGDPRAPGAFVGPVISTKDADRIESWISAAVAGGARILHGGGREGNVIQPTVLADVPPDADLFCREVFGPVVSVVPFDTLEKALAEVDATPYGLAAGIFTSNIGKALRAAERLRMGSVHINETSSSRVDLMPYGGVKLSGIGLEGPRYAIAEMSELRLVSFGPP